MDTAHDRPVPVFSVQQHYLPVLVRPVGNVAEYLWHEVFEFRPNTDKSCDAIADGPCIDVGPL